MGVKIVKKSQREKILAIENLRKKSGAIDASITNKIQEIEERISGANDTIESIDTTVKENAKCKQLLTKSILDTIRRPNLRIIGLEGNEDPQLKEPVNIFNKIIEENFPNLKLIPMSIQEAYRIPNTLDQKKNSSCHIVIKTSNAQNKEKIKSSKGKGSSNI